MRRDRFRASFIFSAAIVGGLLLPEPARADMRVIESSAAAYPVGRMIRGRQAPELKKGESVRVLMLPEMTTRVFRASREAERSYGGSRSSGRPRP